MSHKVSTTLLLFACFLGMNASLCGQNAAAARGIQGYLDPRTGVFHTLPRHAEPDAEPPTLTTFAGKLVFNFTITVNATIAPTAKIACTAIASVDDNLTGGSPMAFTESASALATRSGTTATCTVNIPYSWNLATGSTDHIMLSYYIQAPTEIAVVTDALPARSTIVSDLGTIKVPATGTTTTETITARF